MGAIVLDHHPGSGFWYADDEAATCSVAVLNAMREYRAAEAEMRKRSRATMKLNESDMLALRLLLAARKTGRNVSPTELSKSLDITTASTTGLIDRLVRSGHVERRPNPDDGRAVIIVPTTSSDTEVRVTLSEVHARMMEVAQGLSPDEAAIIVGFLAKMRAAVETVD
jgi:DNA-binding MarR family transcriptional regulator